MCSVVTGVYVGGLGCEMAIFVSVAAAAWSYFVRGHAVVIFSPWLRPRGLSLLYSGVESVATATSTVHAVTDRESVCLDGCNAQLCCLFENVCRQCMSHS